MPAPDRWIQAATPTIPLRRPPMGRPTPGGPITLPGQAPPPAPRGQVGSPGARAAFGGYETQAQLPGYMRSMWQGGRPTWGQPQAQQAGGPPGWYMPSMQEQQAAYRTSAGIDPRAQAPATTIDWINVAMNLRSAADRREQDRLTWEYKELQDQRSWDMTTRQLDEMMRQFGITSGATADWRQGQLGMQQARLGQQYAQMQQTGAYQQQGLSQRWAEMEMQRQQQAAALQQRRREMGAGIGQQIAGLQSQQWAQGMPYALPSGTMFAPGMGPGGPVSEMARRSGVSYTPPRLAKTPPPSRKDMIQWIDDAIGAFA